MSGSGAVVEHGARLRGLLDLRHGMAAALEHLRQSFPLTAFRRDQQDGRRRAHFTRTCLAYLPEASGSVSITMSVPAS